MELEMFSLDATNSQELWLIFGKKKSDTKETQNKNMECGVESVNEIILFFHA